MTYPTGQIKLCNASILIVGAGGLGCPAAQYLAAAGLGMKIYYTYTCVVGCNDIDKILDLLQVSGPVSYVTMAMVTRHAFRFWAVEFCLV